MKRGSTAWYNAQSAKLGKFNRDCDKFLHGKFIERLRKAGMAASFAGSELRMVANGIMLGSLAGTKFGKAIRNVIAINEQEDLKRMKKLKYDGIIPS